MALIGARASDWHTNNPRLRPGLWIASLIAAAIVIFTLMATVGSLVNGNGRPSLEQHSFKFPVERWPS
jgi:hypothetical protein